ncbi:hypothetical protein GUN87_005096 [Salmonella enterica]|nr:hypothetical protein [Salmonella enterica]
MLENFNDAMAKGFAYGTTTVMWVLLIGGFLWLWLKRDEWIPISLVTPLFIGMLWITLKPVFNYLADPQRRDNFFMREMPWYGDSLWQNGIFFAILIIGYGIVWLKWRQGRSYW